MQCFYYWALDLPTRRITDKEHRVPVFEVQVKYKDRAHKVAVFADQNGRVELLRLTLVGLQNERIPDELLPFIQSIREHMLTTLRLAYDARARLFDYHFWAFKPDGESPTTDLAIDFNLQPHLRGELMRNVFTNSFNHREEFRLFNDGTNEGIPPQYRFLSLYKLLEIRFRKKGEWQSEFSDYMSRFKSQFDEKQLSSDPISLIHALRDKCAHIKTGKKRELLGVSELNHKELVIVLKVLPIMAEIGADILQTLTEQRVIIRHNDKAARWDEVAEAQLRVSRDAAEGA
jgi:hypothetical protein